MVTSWQLSPGLGVVGSPGRFAIVQPKRPGQVPVILEGSAALIWEALSTAPGVEANELAAATGIGVAHVDTFLASLESLALVRGSEIV